METRSDRSGRARHSVLPASRTAGVCLHLTSLPGRFGIGEIGRHTRQFIDVMRRMQLGVWQFLPIGPTAFGDSPYQPLSTFAGNELLIGLADLSEHGMLREAETRPLEALPLHAVDYGALIPAKHHLLHLAASRFGKLANSRLKAACDDFLESNERLWLHDYALFRTLKARHAEKAWPEWESRFVHRDQNALTRLEAEAGQEIERTKIIQFLFYDQWRRLHAYADEQGVKLFGDMPIYVALDSADAWANPDLLEIGDDGRPAFVAGVPPDYFSSDGQLWGNPLYAWDRHAASGFSWWIERLRAAASIADLVRIDHFRGFAAYWSVPGASPTARDGAWIPGPGDALFVALEDALGKLPIVAEDLGVITSDVDSLRERHDIPGMSVLQFDVAEEGFDLDQVVEDCVCYTGTHDNDTILGWFRGSGDDNRSQAEIDQARRAALAVTNGSPETIHTDMIRAAFSTAAKLAITPMQDFLGLGSEARFNVPGTSGNNWRWRLDASRLGDRLIDKVAELVDNGARSLPAE